MRICYLSSLYSNEQLGGGIRRYILDLSGEMVKRGHQVTILTSGNTKSLDKGLEVIGMGNVGYFSSIPQFFSSFYILKRLKYMINIFIFCNHSDIDILEAAEGGFEHLFVYLIHKRKFKIVTRLHGRTSLTKKTVLTPFLNYLENYVIKKSDFVTSPSFSYAKYISNQIDSEIEIISNPIRHDYSELTKIKRKTNKKVIILTVGILNLRKGVDLLIKVADKFGEDKAVLFILIGKNEEKLSIKKSYKNLLYLGYKSRSEINYYYQICDIFFSPSRFETFGMACAEAMSFGKPIVSSDCIGLKDLVKNGENGYIFKTGNYNNAYDKLNILINDENLRKKFGKYSKKLSKEYDIGKVVNRMEKFYYKCLNSQ